MIYPKLFETIRNYPGLAPHFGTDPVRLYTFGQAPQSTEHVYAVWQTVSGLPQRSLSCPVSVDQWTIQVDVYGRQAKSVRQAGSALVEAIEAQKNADISRFSGESRDRDDGSYRYSFDVTWWQERNP